MNGQDRVNVFSYELGLIKDKILQSKTVEVIRSVVPDYLFTVAASSTGKYHPAYALGDGGLARHTKAVVRIAKSLFPLFGFSPQEEDYIIVSLLLHDAWKHGEVGQDGSVASFTVAEHPLISAKHVKEIYAGVIGEADLETMSGAIASHMGQWNTDYKTKKEILPKPETKIQHFIHLCDYLASRKLIDINWEVYV